MHYIYLFYKQPVYKQLVLQRQTAKNILVVRYQLNFQFSAMSKALFGKILKSLIITMNFES